MVRNYIYVEFMHINNMEFNVVKQLLVFFFQYHDLHFLCIRFGMILITQIRIFSKRVIYICPPMQVAIYCTSIFLVLSTSIKHTTYNIPGRDQCKLKLCVYIMFINDSLRLTYIVNNYKYGSIIVL